MTIDPHIEARRRLKKALRLASAIESLNAKRILPSLIVSALRDQDDAWWSEVARRADVPNPSVETREWVIEIFKHRAEAA